jgi:hypothetical protein
MHIPFVFCIAFIQSGAIDRMVCSGDGQWQLLGRLAGVCLSALCFMGAGALVYSWRKHESNEKAL